MIAIMGATGHTGSVVAERLLERKAGIRVLGRNAERLRPFAERGAETAVGDAADPTFLASALRGAEAVYAMIPPDYHAPDLLAVYDRTGDAIAKALKSAAVRRVAFLSSLGAELPSGTGPIAGLHGVEERLKGLPGLDLLILRPGYFFENYFGSLGLIRSRGINGGAIAPDHPFAQTATRDIGEAAADAFRKNDFRGTVVRELLGPRDLTMAEATRIIGAKIGKPDLPYVQFPDDGFVAGLMQAGFSRNAAQLLVEMAHAIGEGRVRSLEGRNAKNTTSTTFESFAETLAQAYRAG